MIDGICSFYLRRVNRQPLSFYKCLEGPKNANGYFSSELIEKTLRDLESPVGSSLRIGMVKEKQGSFLDAEEAYLAALEILQPTDDDSEVLRIFCSARVTSNQRKRGALRVAVESCEMYAQVSGQETEEIRTLRHSHSREHVLALRHVGQPELALGQLV